MIVFFSVFSCVWIMRCCDLPYILENGANCRIIRTTFSWHIYILDDRWRRTTQKRSMCGLTKYIEEKTISCWKHGRNQNSAVHSSGISPAAAAREGAGCRWSGRFS
ncbi:hypothetical protein BRADI_3g15304v3 [Brachypodium distachyon]|uniref:Secreted protein n=1 Tax=Brachypodium distachyon TaxID=15368 RepID=A0A2K2CXB9_BRADI|nr:hypothetical protein BRADI_3g15304v3 [Brachypodium distachyon]